jgi:hypothetical protein
MPKLYKITTCECKEDFDNYCYIPSDGGLYTKEDAIRILENGNGGSITDGEDRSYRVNYDKSKNKWLEDI